MFELKYVTLTCCMSNVLVEASKWSFYPLQFMFTHRMSDAILAGCKQCCHCVNRETQTYLNFIYWTADIAVGYAYASCFQHHD